MRGTRLKRGLVLVSFVEQNLNALEIVDGENASEGFGAGFELAASFIEFHSDRDHVLGSGGQPRGLPHVASALAIAQCQDPEGADDLSSAGSWPTAASTEGQSQQSAI